MKQVILGAPLWFLLRGAAWGVWLLLRDRSPFLLRVPVMDILFPLRQTLLPRHLRRSKRIWSLLSTICYCRTARLGPWSESFLRDFKQRFYRMPLGCSSRPHPVSLRRNTYLRTWLCSRIQRFIPLHLPSRTGAYACLHGAYVVFDLSVRC